MEWCGYNWKSSMDGGRIIHKKQPWQWYSMENIIRDKTDMLELFVNKNPREVKYWDGTIYNPEYEVSTIRSMEDFGYGIFSAEMMMPKGKNLSASFWLTGSENWPPEIDINETFIDNTGNIFKVFEKYFPWIKPGWTTTTNMHYRNEKMEKTHVGSRNISWFKQKLEPSENWIKYECIWEPNCITFKVNGKISRTIKGFECIQMRKNIENPEKGFRMNVIFNVWTEDPVDHRIDIVQPMMIRNFKYTQL